MISKHKEKHTTLLQHNIAQRLLKSEGDIQALVSSMFFCFLRTTSSQTKAEERRCKNKFLFLFACIVRPVAWLLSMQLGALLCNIFIIIVKKKNTPVI
jgi:hypothetical protein